MNNDSRPPDSAQTYSNSSRTDRASADTQRPIGCACHCRACNGCFGSLKAFDTHRQFEEGHPNDWDHRVCIEPMDDARFAPKTLAGVCRLARPPKASTAIWTLAKSRQEWAERKRVKRLTASEASGGTGGVGMNPGSSDRTPGATLEVPAEAAGGDKNEVDGAAPHRPLCPGWRGASLSGGRQ